MPGIAAEALTERTGLVGGLVYDESGQQSLWNYGPRQSFFADLGGFAQSSLEQLRANHPTAARSARHILHGLMEDWPDPTQRPTAHNTYWVLEANMLVRSEHLAKAGGFDPAIREHDIQDLAIRMQKMELTSVFEPRIAVTQHNVNVRDYDRSRARIQAEWHIARKNGLLQWFFPDRRLKPRYNQ